MIRRTHPALLISSCLHDLKAGHALEPHLPHRPLLYARLFDQADLRPEHVRLLDEPPLVPPHLLQVPVVIPQPRAVRLLGRIAQDLVGGDVLDGPFGDAGHPRGDGHGNQLEGHVLELAPPHVLLLVIGEEESPLPVLPGAGRPPKAVDVLRPVR